MSDHFVIPTSETVRGTFSVRKSHLWYAFASELIPGATKIGDTTRDVPTRVDEWRRDFPDARILGKGNLEILPGTFVRDHALHRGCELLGYHRLQAEEFVGGKQLTTEAYSVDPEHAIEAIDEVIEDVVLSHDDPESPYTYYSVESDRKEVGIAHYERDPFDWELRPMQRDMVDRFIGRYYDGTRNMLANASVRFGKTFTALSCGREIHAKRILVVSAKADVENEWKKATEKPGQFAGWVFVSPDMLRAGDDALEEAARDSECVVCFATLQDLQGSETKRRHRQLLATKWDLLIVDETHFGARGEEYGEPLGLARGARRYRRNKKAKIADQRSRREHEVFEDEDDEALSEDKERAAEIKKRIDYRYAIHLSGTPYRILMSNEFPADAVIASVTLNDMLHARDEWNRENPDADPVDNPLYGLPTPVHFALRGDGEAQARIDALADEGGTVKLKELFRAEGSGKSTRFVHEAEVEGLLEMVDGKDRVMGFLSYDVAEDNDLFRHMLCLLPTKAACDAMELLVKRMSDEGRLDRLSEYEVLNVTGHNRPKRYANVANIADEIENHAAAGRKTLTLTVMRLTTGTTVRAWDTILMFSGMSSPEAYGQATGRLMSAYVDKAVATDGSGKVYTVNRKPYVVVVDPDVSRVFKMAEGRATVQRTKQTDAIDIDTACERELTYSPIITANEDGFTKVTPTDMRLLISKYASQGIAEEIKRIPIDDNLFYDLDFMDAIKRFEDVSCKPKAEIAVDSYEGDKSALDVPEPEDADVPLDADEPVDSYDAGDNKDSDDKEDKNREKFEQRVRQFYLRMAAFAASWDKHLVKSIDEIRTLIRTNEKARKMAMQLGIYTDFDVLCGAVKEFSASSYQLDNAIYNISYLVNVNDSMTGMEKARTLMGKFGSMGKSEVATPVWTAEKMVKALPDEAFERDTPVFLDLASKTGEMAYALVERCATMGKVPLVRSIPTGEVAYVLTCTSYRLMGLDEREVAANFNSYDLLGKDVTAVAKALRQDKSCSQIDLFDLFGGMVADDKVHDDTSMLADSAVATAIGCLDFDAVVSNPPYQKSDGGAGASALPIYPEFTNVAIATDARFVTLIMPSRWFSGGKGLNSFRDQMLHDRHITTLVDFPVSTDCFPDIQIKGGVCFFVRTQEQEGPCAVTTIRNGIASCMTRELLESQVETFIRYNEAVSIYRKVTACNEATFDALVSSRKPFGLSTAIKGGTKINDDDVQLFLNKNIAWISRTDIPSHADWIDQYKILISYAYGAGEDFPHQIINKPFVVAPGSACTETYLVIGPFASAEIAHNVLSYMSTKFFRFMVLLLKNTQHATKNVYRFVPQQDWSKSWNDEELYSRYQLEQDEIDFIEAMIRPMSLQ